MTRLPHKHYPSEELYFYLGGLFTTLNDKPFDINAKSLFIDNLVQMYRGYVSTLEVLKTELSNPTIAWNDEKSVIALDAITLIEKIASHEFYAGYGRHDDYGSEHHKQFKDSVPLLMEYIAFLHKGGHRVSATLQSGCNAGQDLAKDWQMGFMI